MVQRQRQNVSPAKHSAPIRRDKLSELARQLEAANARIADLEAQLKLRDSGFDEAAAAKGNLFDTDSLTSRERQVIDLFMWHANDKKVAAELGIAVQTVRNHMATIERKCRVASREELILLLLAGQPLRKQRSS